MHPRSYEILAAQHVDAMRRDAAGEQLLARAGVTRRGSEARSRVRRWLDRLGSVRRTGPGDVTGPGRDLRAARRPELGQDVLHVAAGGLGRDPQ